MTHLTARNAHFLFETRLRCKASTPRRENARPNHHLQSHKLLPQAMSHPRIISDVFFQVSSFKLKQFHRRIPVKNPRNNVSYTYYAVLYAVPRLQTMAASHLGPQSQQRLATSFGLMGFGTSAPKGCLYISKTDSTLS